MELWEVFKELKEHPSRTYRNDEDDRTWTIKTDYDADYPNDDVYYLIECSTDADLHGNIGTTDNGWYMVKHQVPWQEAIQEVANGKHVWCEFHSQSWGVGELVENHLYFKKALDIGKWYVED